MPEPSNERESPSRAASPVRQRHLLHAALLIGVVLLTHGWSLWDGLFFDDHWHRVQLRERGWGFEDLVESATFDLPGELNTLWWQEQPLQWRYARPVAMLAMKVEYVLTGGYPMGIHACAIGWHAATTLLVYALACWALADSRWAFLAAAMFAFYPHSVSTVGWIAARNALVSGFFFVAATLLYLRSSFAGRTPRAHGGLFWSLAALASWGMALFARETAVVWPLVVAGIDLGFGGWRHARRRLRFYLAVTVLTLAYLYWRLAIFPQRDVPEIYFTAPSGPAYVLWAAAKLVHMLFAQIFYTPMLLGPVSYGGGSAGGLAMAVMLLVVFGVAGWFIWAARGQRGAWVWPMWAVVAFLPVVPVFLMPHFSYLPAAAYVIMIAMMLRRLPTAPRVVVTGLVLIATLWSHGVYRALWRGIVRSEQLIYADIRSQVKPPPEGASLVFVNLPIAGIYAPIALREAWNRSDLTGHVLTFAPYPLAMQHDFVLEQTGERELTLSIDEPGFFAGISGKMLIDGMRPGAPLRAGDSVQGPLFDTTIVETSDTGITRLRFAFHEPLESDRLLIFASSPDRPAYRVRLFSRHRVPLVPPPGETKEFRAAHQRWLDEQSLYFMIEGAARSIVRSDLYLTGAPR